MEGKLTRFRKPLVGEISTLARVSVAGSLVLFVTAFSLQLFIRYQSFLGGQIEKHPDREIGVGSNPDNLAQ